MFVSSRCCLIISCILLILNVLCQGKPQLQSVGLAFGYAEDDETKPTFENNDQNKTPIVNVPGLCRSGENFYPGDQHDDWVCDCKPGYVYHPKWQQCFPVFRRGPCVFGQYLIKPRDRGTPECQRNPCVHDKFVPFRNGCYELDTAGPCIPPEKNAVGVNETTWEIICTKDYIFSSLG